MCPDHRCPVRLSGSFLFRRVRGGKVTFRRSFFLPCVPKSVHGGERFVKGGILIGPSAFSALLLYLLGTLGTLGAFRALFFLGEVWAL